MPPQLHFPCSVNATTALPEGYGIDYLDMVVEGIRVWCLRQERLEKDPHGRPTTVMPAYYDF